MPRHIIVDGYNLLFAIGRTSHASDRTYLLNLLASYKGRRDVDVTVVFDRKTGFPAEGRETLLHQGVKVIFSAPAQEADEIICHIAETSKNPRNLLVVSSDKAGVTKYCRKIGAAVAESLEFFEFLTGRPSRTADEDEEKPQVRREDVEYYLKKFNREK